MTVVSPDVVTLGVNTPDSGLMNPTASLLRLNVYGAVPPDTKKVMPRPLADIVVELGLI